MPAAVVLAVGDQDQRPLRVPAVAHLLDPHAHGVEERGPALRPDREHRLANAGRVPREVVQEAAALVEADDEELVLRVVGLEKADHRLARKPEVLLHAPARVQQHAGADRGGFLVEVRQGLLHRILEHAKVLLRQVVDETVGSIRDRHLDEHGVDADPERRAGVVLAAGLRGGGATRYEERERDRPGRPAEQHRNLPEGGMVR